jgi:hypothetical protein
MTIRLLIILAAYLIVAGTVCASRRAPWFLWLWLPFVLTSLAGVAFGVFCLFSLFDLSGQGGEAAGFAGIAYFFGSAYGIPFLIGLIVAFKIRPAPKTTAN